MMLALVFALAGIPDPASTAAPRTIYTVKSSPLCNAVRDVIAPAIFALHDQDQRLMQSRMILIDQARMAASGGSGYVALDNQRLLRNVDQLAKTNIDVGQMLDKLNKLRLRDPQEIAYLKKLQAQLRAVADRQADALNMVSGVAYSYESNVLMGLQNPVSVEFKRVDSGPQQDAAAQQDGGTDAGASSDIGNDQVAAGLQELGVAPALAPVISHCR